MTPIHLPHQPIQIGRPRVRQKRGGQLRRPPLPIPPPHHRLHRSLRQIIPAPRIPQDMPMPTRRKNLSRYPTHHIAPRSRNHHEPILSSPRRRQSRLRIPTHHHPLRPRPNLTNHFTHHCPLHLSPDPSKTRPNRTRNLRQLSRHLTQQFP